MSFFKFNAYFSKNILFILKDTQKHYNGYRLDYPFKLSWCINPLTAGAAYIRVFVFY